MISRTRDPAELARRAATVPDEPRWVDARGFLLSGRAELVTGDGGWLLLADDWPLGFVVGRPETAALATLAELADRPGEEPIHALAQLEDLPGLVERLPAPAGAAAGWRRDDAMLHRWPAGHAPDLPPLPAGYEVRRVGAEEPLDLAAFSDDTVRELRLYRTREPWTRWPIAFAFAPDATGPTATTEGRRRPVAFCVTAVATDGLWDVSIETLPSHRRRGLAAACFEHLRRYHAELATGSREPVWGAHQSNAASLALARRLGFLPSARLACLLADRPTV